MGHPAPNNISTERVIIPSGAKQAAEKPLIPVNMRENRPSVAKATADSNGFTRGLKPPSPSELSFSAACKVVPCYKTGLLSSFSAAYNVLLVAISHRPYGTVNRILPLTQDCAALVLG